MSNADVNFDELAGALTKLQELAHQTAKSKGWWDDHDRLLKAVGDSPALQNQVDALYLVARSMLVVTEVSEGVEGYRMGDPPDDKVPEFSSMTVELADTVIRILDLAARFHLPVAQAMVAKMAFNNGRSYKHGNKVL